MLYDFCRGNITCLACLFSKLHLTPHQGVYSAHHFKLYRLCFLCYKQQSGSRWSFGSQHPTARLISHLKVCAASTRSLDHMSHLCQHYPKVPRMSLCFPSQKVETRLFGGGNPPPTAPYIHTHLIYKPWVPILDSHNFVVNIS